MNRYAEPDPRDDLSCLDTQRKMLTLCREIGGMWRRLAFPLPPSLHGPATHPLPPTLPEP